MSIRTVCILLVLTSCTPTPPAASVVDGGHGAVDASVFTAVMDASVPDAFVPDASVPAVVDRDEDGLDDGQEALWAEEYLPYVSVHPEDECPLHGIVYRIAPHPTLSGVLMAWFDVLYERDCGASGHPGDNECFGVVFDPRVPAPEGIKALRTISHQATACERVNTCGRCGGLDPCTVATRNGRGYPVVFASKNKHGGYAREQSCDVNVICDFGGCGLNASPSNAPMVNAGERSHPLVDNLTTQGFIHRDAGWVDMATYDYDPWSSAEFGTAGVVGDDLDDPEFVFSAADCAP